jgi:hypothetical protein
MPRGTTPNTNIQLESEIDFKDYTNMDQFRDKYKIKVLMVNESNTVEIREIITIDLNVPFLEQNRYFLLSNSTQEQMKSRYLYRPDYVSYDEYGTTAFDFLILYINNIFSAAEFDLEYYVLPSKTAVNELVLMNAINYPDREQIKDISVM